MQEKTPQLLALGWPWIPTAVQCPQPQKTQTAMILLYTHPSVEHHHPSYHQYLGRNKRATPGRTAGLWLPARHNHLHPQGWEKDTKPAQKAPYLSTFSASHMSTTAARPKMSSLPWLRLLPAMFKLKEAKGRIKRHHVNQEAPAPLHPALSSCCCATPLVWEVLCNHSRESEMLGGCRGWLQQLSHSP